MGIRFLCPNGHKLNVKSFLAGKRGICPQCGCKVLIPGEVHPDPVSVAASLENETSSASVSAREPLPVHRTMGNVSTPASATSAGIHQPRQEAVAQRTDPIAEAPHAVWLVRPPSGGEYGPATGDVLRTWIEEGRVTPDSLVWREGWPNWQAAGPLFPGLAAEVPAAASGFPNIVTAAEADSSTTRYRQRTKQRSDVFWVGALAVACVVLFIILVYIIMWR
jgi:hypothetical protein